MNCRSEYTNRLQSRQQTHEKLRHEDDRIVLLRSITFLVGLIVCWMVFGNWQISWLMLLLPIGLFVAIVFYHESVKRKLRNTERAIEYYQRCLDRLDGQWSEVGPTGEEFLDPQHPYTDDLDIFGNGSLYQLLGSPITPTGCQTLAAWLAPSGKQKLPTSEIVSARQEAVRSLRDQIDLREELAVIGPSVRSREHTEKLHRWLSNAGGLTALWILIIALVLGLLGLTAFVALLVTRLIAALMLVAIVQLLFLRKMRQPLENIKQ